MIKEEFIKEVSKRSGVRQTDVSKSLESGINVIIERLLRGDYVLFAGFGRFETSIRAAKRIEDFNGKEVYTQETRAPVFRPGKTFKDIIAKSGR